MFAHDLYHCQIEYLMNSIYFNRKDRATRGASAYVAQAPALRERLPQIFNSQ
jgi:hypothetical protein